MCKYCNSEHGIYPEPFAHEELNVLRSCFVFEVEVYSIAKELVITYADIDGGEQYLLMSVPINFCPNCGAKL